MPQNLDDSPLWPADNSAVTAHIALLQGIISRLANNSASCKSWCLTVVGAFLALIGTTHMPQLLSAALFTVLMFAYVDIRYLAQEIAYRHLYDCVVAAIQAKTYTLDRVFVARVRCTCHDIGKALRSWSIFPFYGVLILLYAAARWGGWNGEFGQGEIARSRCRRPAPPGGPDVRS